MAETTKTGMGMHRGGGAERRRHKRFLPRECDMSLIKEASGLFKVFGAGSKDNLAQAVVDLSEGGARFVTRTKLSIGTKVNVTINVRLFNDTIKTVGCVCWSADHNQKNGHYYVAINFEKLDPLQARKISSIRDYLQSPEFRQKEETRRRTRPAADTSSLEYDA